MYLKEIKAHGFKSFADKITIELDKNITGIVGPNGSGKSNVVDAVRWVLGEQSIKSLRGEGNMTDVIFSGSKSRNSSNTASVSLIFDNHDKYIPLDYEEVEIKRTVYKDGTNEYFINNEKVRLKDVTNILLDTGLAKESFNIISQGKIEEILSSKPNERRIIFEEAAGVLKYKRRKEDALRKLDRTHNNMDRINDIISELETQVEPLREQKEKALEYNKVTDELKDYEIALIVNDITDINFEYQNSKNKIDALNDEISKISVNTSTNESKIAEFKLSITKLDDEIKQKQQELINITSEVEKINSRKNIIIERQKYQVDDAKLYSNIINLKETQINLETEINKEKISINNISDEVNDLVAKINELNKKTNQIKEKRNELESVLTNKLRNENNLKNKISNLVYNIENNGTLPASVKNVLENPKLRGINDTIGNVIDVKEEYSTAIMVALGLSTNNVIVDTEDNAKEAINYLKNNNLGRVTFFPISVIKPKGIDLETLNLIKNDIIDIASNLVTFDNKYNGIITNQLGNIIVVKNIDIANKISKKINYRYRIVTLDGELLHAGGSITGGSVSKNKNVIFDRYELEKSNKELNILTDEIKLIENNISNIDIEFRNLEDSIYLVNKDRIEKTTILENITKLLNEKIEHYKIIELEINGTNNIIENKLSNEEEEVLNEYSNVVKKKDSISNELNLLIKHKDDTNDELVIFETSLKKENGSFIEKSNELKDLEILVNRYDVKLDNLLNILNDNYTITYEEAIKKYKLDIPVNIARTKVNNLKRILKEIGIVNLGAIEEYDRVNTRYEFLVKQRDDLTKAENTLLEIIDEMDSIMEKEFISTFKIIQNNFSTTFKELFKGGNAELKLTDPNNILETGVEIIASPPGKNLKTISLLSGGEKTFTAISLLFAILKSKPVSFCILDEVEAALDEVNVESFGEYLGKLKNKTQFILITHKKKTMEYADTLYGITMQESGVSKLVSVKLEGEI